MERNKNDRDKSPAKHWGYWRPPTAASGLRCSRYASQGGGQFMGGRGNNRACWGRKWGTWWGREEVALVAVMHTGSHPLFLNPFSLLGYLPQAFRCTIFCI